MMITSKAIQRIVQVMQGHESTQRVPQNGSQVQPRKDEVVLSDQGKQIRALQQRLAETPEVRANKVQELREAIERGEYTISSERIAEGILRHHLDGQ